MQFDISKFEGAIFDLDGTLLDSTDVWGKIDIDFLAKRGIEVPEDYLRNIRNHNFETGSVYTVERFSLKESPEDIANEWMDMARYEFHNNIELKPNSKLFLHILKQSGLKLGVATSSDRELYAKCLERNEIYNYFDAFTETKEVKNGKGFPDVYLKTAKKMGINPCNCVVFEDILKGVEGAKKGGFYTVGVYDKASLNDIDLIKNECDKFIYDYEEILEYMSY